MGRGVGCQGVGVEYLGSDEGRGDSRGRSPIHCQKQQKRSKNIPGPAQGHIDG